MEPACNAQCMDGLLAVGGCDKNMPGAMIAMARMNIPAVFVYGGTIKPGHYKDRDLTVVSVFEAVGEHRSPENPHRERPQVHERALPGPAHPHPLPHRAPPEGAGPRHAP